MIRVMDGINALTERIIGAAIEVHRNLGPGLLEHTYQTALMVELELRGIKAEAEVDVPYTYKGVKLDVAYRADIVVENEIIVELKSTTKDNPLFEKQLHTYLKLADKKIGLLINFNHSRLIDGVTRIVKHD